MIRVAAADIGQSFYGRTDYLPRSARIERSYDGRSKPRLVVERETFTGSRTANPVQRRDAWYRVGRPGESEVVRHRHAPLATPEPVDREAQIGRWTRKASVAFDGGIGRRSSPCPPSIDRPHYYAVLKTVFDDRHAILSCRARDRPVDLGRNRFDRLPIEDDPFCSGPSPTGRVGSGSRMRAIGRRTRLRGLIRKEGPHYHCHDRSVACDPDAPTTPCLFNEQFRRLDVGIADPWRPLDRGAHGPTLASTILQRSKSGIPTLHRRWRLGVGERPRSDFKRDATEACSLGRWHQGSIWYRVPHPGTPPGPPSLQPDPVPPDLVVPRRSPLASDTSGPHCGSAPSGGPVKRYTLLKR